MMPTGFHVITSEHAPKDHTYFINPAGLMHGGLLLADWLRLCDILIGYDIRWYDSRNHTEEP